MRLITAVFYALFVVFLVLYIRTIDFDSLRDLRVNIPLLILACVLSMAFRFWSAYIWRRILENLGARISDNAELTYVYAKSWLGRYLPGKVTWILGKIYFASQQGISTGRLAVSATLEAALQIVVTLALSVLFLVASLRFGIIDPAFQVYLLVFAALLLLFLHPRVFNFTLDRVSRVLRRKQFDAAVGWSTIWLGTWLYGVAFLLSGTSFYLFALSLYPELDARLFLYLVGAFSLSGIVGIVAIFAPSGLGVREAVQLVLFNAVMPPDVALVLTVASRLWSVAIDLAFYALALALARR